MKWIKFLVVFAFVVASCATEDEKMQKYIIGNWETVFVKLEFETFKGKDTLVEYDIDFANPDDPRAQRQGKAFSTYKADGTFKSWTEKNNRPTGQSTTGKWRVTKDSLFYDFAQGPGKKDVTVSFGLEKIDDGFAITGIQDRDSDRAVDDTIYLETVRLPDTPEE
ncbi:hypothetical protein [Flavicella sp.]|uniref:hypothetical protein n=1 Tax=Flavicella sp. TaxID=2957742 RepID=UPI0026380DFF|nr:hypothetical protein [Flavicella sp.]MDG1806124.1 hypothetical protein [Flavicella sp.]MDG2279177.1 hypothetical protein [Flavicella sp.]